MEKAAVWSWKRLLFGVGKGCCLELEKAAVWSWKRLLFGVGKGCCLELEKAAVFSWIFVKLQHILFAVSLQGKDCPFAVSIKLRFYGFELKESSQKKVIEKLKLRYNSEAGQSNTQ